jgi:hypothetical protein
MRRGIATLVITALACGAAVTAHAAAGADGAKTSAADTAHAAPAHPPLPSGHPGTAPAHGTAGPAPKPFKIVVPPGTPKVKSVTLGIRHRVFHDFAEEDEARMREPFTIGDTPYSATVMDFLPDFVIDVGARRITSRSNEPRNPAVRIIVRENGVPQDTSWAFLNMPPHFAARSLLAFKLLRIDFTDRPPLLADTSSLAHPRADSSAARARPPDTASAKKSKP